MARLLTKRIFLVLLAVVLFATRAQAAKLYLEPPQVQVSIGNIVNIQIFVDTSGEVINNAESIIQFPSDLLEVVSVDKTSIFSLWVEEPNFSNNIGQLKFNGGLPNPGFQGVAGKIASVVFRAKKAGAASVIFLDSAVRENDGLGTDILSSKNGAVINIVQEPGRIEQTDNLSIHITSSSHPNQNVWYNKSDVSLSWTLPRGVAGVKTFLGSHPNSEPTVYYSSPITSKSIKNLEDGIWYFHANYLKDGVWSLPEHFRLKIDTANPTDLEIEQEKDETGQIILKLKASDALSGVDHFKIVPDKDEPITVKSDQNGEASAEIPLSSAGEHVISVFAYDKAGNFTEAEVNVLASIISELNIDSYPAKIRVNESLEASGSAPYPYAPIRISLKDDRGIVSTYKVKSDSYSKFDFMSQPITREGKYVLWAEIVNDTGDIKYTSDKLIVVVEKPLLLQIGSYTIGLMKVLIPALALILVFLLLLLYGWLKFLGLYRRVRKESAEAKNTIEKSFNLLKKEVKSHISKFRKAEVNRKLTSEEINFLENFEEKLSGVEKVITKEIKDISD